MERKINQVNQIFENALASYHLAFIKHDNIDIDCLWKDGIHLTEHSNFIFTSNFVGF